MNRLLLLTAVLVSLGLVVRRLTPAARSRILERLAQMPVRAMERCMDSMPENSPPKVMMSTMRRLEEQNDELLALLREQNTSLRRQTDLPGAEAKTAESAEATSE